MYTDCFKTFIASCKKLNNKKCSLAILRNVQFDGEYAVYTDLDTTIRLKLDLPIPVGSGFLVDLKEIKTSLEDLKKSKVILISQEGLTDYPSMTFSKWTIQDKSIQPVSDFPACPSMDNMEFVSTVNQTHITKANACVTEDDCRPVLGGIYLDGERKQIVSTNGRCLLIKAWSEMSDKSIVLPRGLNKVLSGLKGCHSVYMNEKFIRVDIYGNDYLQVISRKIDDTYPAYHQVLAVLKTPSRNKVSFWNRGIKVHYFKNGTITADESGATFRTLFDGDFEFAMSGVMVEQVIEAMGDGMTDALYIQHNGDGEQMMSVVNEYGAMFVFMPLRAKVKPQVEGV